MIFVYTHSIFFYFRIISNIISKFFLR